MKHSPMLREIDRRYVQPYMRNLRTRVEQDKADDEETKRLVRLGIRWARFIALVEEAETKE